MGVTQKEIFKIKAFSKGTQKGSSFQIPYKKATQKGTSFQIPFYCLRKRVLDCKYPFFRYGKGYFIKYPQLEPFLGYA